MVQEPTFLGSNCYYIVYDALLQFARPVREVLLGRIFGACIYGKCLLIITNKCFYDYWYKLISVSLLLSVLHTGQVVL